MNDQHAARTHTLVLSLCLNMDNVPARTLTGKKRLGLVQLLVHPRFLLEPLRQAARVLLSTCVPTTHPSLSPSLSG